MAAEAPIHELAITRLINATPERVYDVWTTRLGEWWAPRPNTTPVVELDLRPGGRGRMDMRSPEGVDMPHEGVFLEVEPNRKIVLTNAFRAGWIHKIPSWWRSSHLSPKEMARAIWRGCGTGARRP